MPILHWNWWIGVFLVGTILWALPSVLTVFLSTIHSPVLGPLQHFLVIFLSIITIFLFNKRVRKIDFGIENVKLGKIIIWTAIGLVCIVATQYIAYYTSPKVIGDSSQEVFKQFGLGESLWKDFWTLFYIALSGPMAEEFVFRGIIFRSLRDGLARIKFFSKNFLMYLPVVISIVISSLLFVLMHAGVVQGPQLLAMFFMSCIFALAYYLTGSLYVAIMIHTINNAYVIYNQIKIYGEGVIQFNHYFFLILFPIISFSLIKLISKTLK